MKLLTLMLTAIVIFLGGTTKSQAHEKHHYTPVPHGWHAPARWLGHGGRHATGAICVHEHESGNWHLHNEPYANGFQFTIGTWQEAGGLASSWVTASPREQVYRAYVIWLGNGGHWKPDWPQSSTLCGLN